MLKRWKVIISHHMEKVRDGFWQKKEGSRKQRREGRLERTKRCQKQSRLRNKKKRAKEKKNEIESVKKWRKQRQQSGFPGDEKDFDTGLSFEDGNIFESLNKKRPEVHPGDRSGGKARQGAGKGKPGALQKETGQGV